MRHNSERQVGEFAAGSFSVFRDPVSVTEALSGNLLKGYIAGLNIVNKDKLITRQNFAELLRTAFLLNHPVESGDVSFDASEHDPSDEYFARKFRHEVVPLACARVTQAGFIDAWIGPTLVYERHPLASAENGQVHIEISKSDTGLRIWRKDVLMSVRPSVTAHYLRCIVADQPSVLASVLDVIAQNGISVCEIQQPETQEGKPAEIGVLLDPCKTDTMLTALNTIRRLPVCLSVGPLYRVLGNPTKNLSS